MNAGRFLVIVVFLILSLGNTKVNAQTLAVGHAFAEVVESVSASSAAISNFELSKSSEAASATLQAENLNLGAITINSGRNVTCNIVLTPASLTDEEGNSFTIDPRVINDRLSAPASTNGIQTFHLGASSNISHDQASGMYEGSYTVIFAYN